MTGTPIAKPSAWLERVLGVFGVLFSLAWGVSVAAFPFMKGQILGYVPVAIGAGLGVLVLRRRADIEARLTSLPESWFLAAVLAAAVLLRVAAVLIFPFEPANDHEMFLRLAVGMRNGEGYHLAGGPSAFFPPGMPLLLVGWFYLLPVGTSSAKLLGLLIGVGVVPLTYWAGKRLLGPTEARLATAIMASNPTAVFYSATIGYELLLASLLLVVVILDAKAVVRDRLSWPRVLAIGTLAGAAALVKPTSLLIPLLLAIVWAIKLPLARALMGAGVAAVFMLAVISPWTMRNWRVLGSPVLISTNGGPVLYAANNPDSVGLAMGVSPLPGEHDEVSRDSIRRRAALRWAAGHPVHWLWLAARKAAYTWGTSSSIMSYLSYDRMPVWHEDLAKACLNVGWTALLVWVSVATWTTRTWQDSRLMLANLFMVVLFLTHLWFEALSRHHITVLPILALVASASLVTQPLPSGQRRPEESAGQ